MIGNCMQGGYTCYTCVGRREERQRDVRDEGEAMRRRRRQGWIVEEGTREKSDEEDEDEEGKEKEEGKEEEGGGGRGGKCYLTSTRSPHTKPAADPAFSVICNALLPRALLTRAVATVGGGGAPAAAATASVAAAVTAEAALMTFAAKIWKLAAGRAGCAPAPPGTAAAYGSTSDCTRVVVSAAPAPLRCPSPPL